MSHSERLRGIAGILREDAGNHEDAEFLCALADTIGAPSAQYPDDAEIERMARAAGGQFHGPITETLAIEQSKLPAFARMLCDWSAAHQRARHAQCVRGMVFGSAFTTKKVQETLARMIEIGDLGIDPCECAECLKHRAEKDIRSQPAPAIKEAAPAPSNLPADLALEVVQHLADSEPTNRSMDGMDLLRGTSVEDMFVLDGETIRKAVELVISNALYDGAIAAPAPVKEAARDDRAEFEAWVTGRWSTRRHPHGTYLDQNTYNTWEAWQAARAQTDSGRVSDEKAFPGRR